MSVSAVKPSSAESNRHSIGPNVFQPSQAAQNSVIQTRNCGVPMKRAMPSVASPKASGFGASRGTRRPLALSGVSRPVPRPGRRSRAVWVMLTPPVSCGGGPRGQVAGRVSASSRSKARQSSGRMWSSRSSTLTAPTTRSCSFTTGMHVRL